MKIPFTFTPATQGTFTSAYHLTWTDATGAHLISVHITGRAT